MIGSCEGGPPRLPTLILHQSESDIDHYYAITIVIIFFCRQAKLSATERVIEDIDQSDGLQNYYTINSQPDQKANSSNIISRILEKISKK